MASAPHACFGAVGYIAEPTCQGAQRGQSVLTRRHDERAEELRQVLITVIRQAGVVVHDFVARGLDAQDLLVADLWRRLTARH